MAALPKKMAWWQTIIWSNVGMLYWCIDASLDLNELNMYISLLGSF